MDTQSVELLLSALIAREENSPEFVDELQSYRQNLQDGELTEADVAYLQAVARDLGVSVRSPHSRVPEDEEANDRQFVETARGIARDTYDRWQRDLEAEDEERMDRLVSQIRGFAGELKDKVVEDARGEGMLAIPTGEVRMTLENERGQPELFYGGNEKALEMTEGYRELAEKCKELGLKLELENNFHEVWQEQESSKPHELAPTLYHVEVVVSGWT